MDDADTKKNILARLNKVRDPDEKPGQGWKIGYYTNHDEENNDTVTMPNSCTWVTSLD